MRTTWNMELFYKSPQDKQIAKDIEKADRMSLNFSEKYSKQARYTKTIPALQQALIDYERVLKVLQQAKPLVYFYYLHDLDTQDTAIVARFNQLMLQYTEFENRLVFFELALQTISKKQQKIILTDKRLSKWQYFLGVLFAQSPYVLGEEAERVMRLKSVPAHLMWVQANTKQIAKQTIAYKGKKQPLNGLFMEVPSMPVKQREKIHIAIYDRLQELSPLAEAEINAVFTNKKINDDLRGFIRPDASTILHDQMTEQVVDTLVAVIKKHTTIAHAFYEQKARLLKQKTLGYQDRSAIVGSVRTSYTFKRAAALVRKQYAKLDKRYVDIFDRMLEQGQIDVSPRKGKTGGAFCSSTYNNPTFVLLNHSNNLNSVFTLAHEMGHALHAEISKSQPFIYQAHSLATAEVASTTFEALLFNELFEQASEQEQIVLLHDKLQSNISSIFRQIAFYRYEQDLHAKIQEQGSVAKEQMAALFQKRMQEYLGPLFKLQTRDGYGFVHIGHFRRFFYVYTYAFGELISGILAQRVKHDPKHIHDVHTFMKAGGSKSPIDIFNDIGIDVTDPLVWQQGLKNINTDITKLKRLIDAQK